VLRDRTSIIVAALSSVMFVGICALLDSLNPVTWVVAVLLLVGGIALHVGRDDPPSGDEDATDEDAGDRRRTRSRKRIRGRSIYGPPE
jgi:hypothetical protein